MDIGHRLHCYFCLLSFAIHSWIEGCGEWMVAMRSIIFLHCKNVGSGINIYESVESVPVGPKPFKRFWTVSAFRPGRRPYPLQHWEATLRNTSINNFHFPRHRWHRRSQPSQRLQLTSSVIFSFSFHSFPLKLPFFYLINAIFKVIVVYVMPRVSKSVNKGTVPYEKKI